MGCAFVYQVPGILRFSYTGPHRFSPCTGVFPWYHNGGIYMENQGYQRIHSAAVHDIVIVCLLLLSLSVVAHLLTTIACAVCKWPAMPNCAPHSSSGSLRQLLASSSTALRVVL
jgi:hypothetical protein